MVAASFFRLAGRVAASRGFDYKIRQGLPVIRLFAPDAHVTWLLAVQDLADGDTARVPSISASARHADRFSS